MGNIKRPKKAHPTRGVTHHDQEYGRRIRAFRMQREFSQTDLADKLGVSFQQVQKYEKGTNRITVSRLEQIALALETTPHELMGWGQRAIADGEALDIEAYKLAKAFSTLRDEWKSPVRQLINSLMRDS
jgi:transcriptional regulator with XRE-family HTH domain